MNAPSPAAWAAHVTVAAEQLPGFTGQAHVTCKHCPWHVQVVRPHLAREAAVHHLHTAHGITVPEPQPAPAPRKRVTVEPASATLARMSGRR